MDEQRQELVDSFREYKECGNQYDDLSFIRMFAAAEMIEAIEAGAVRKGFGLRVDESLYPEAFTALDFLGFKKTINHLQP